MVIGELKITTKCILVLIGRPGCGKSTLSSNQLSALGYYRVNQDMLGTKQKCLNYAKELLCSGESIVIDATNPSKSSRRDWIDLATSFCIPINILIFDVSYAQASHMNRYREAISCNRQKHVPDIAYKMYDKNYEEPTLDEGFSKILRITPTIRLVGDQKNLFEKWYE